MQDTHATSANAADPAAFEIVKNSFYKIAEEMRVVLCKTAYSPILKSAGDFSCGVFDARGDMVAQGPDLPIHLGSMPDAVRAVVAAFGNDEVTSLLRDIVHQRCNVVVSGAASSGKTTLLNALCGNVAEGERVITVEDIAELRLQTRHVLRFEARPATYDGTLEVSLSALLRSALRMRPDRFVLGEVRGEEALDMLTAMNTGHHGSLATCHANSPDDALRRIESMVLQAAPQWPLAAVREHLQAAVDVIVQVERSPNGRRRISEITEVSMRPDVLGTKVIWTDGGTVARLSRGRS